MRRRLALVLVPIAALAILVVGASSAVALLAGVALALTVGNPWAARSPAIARSALSASVIGLGAGMDLVLALEVGVHGLAYTAAGIGAAMILGTILGRRLHIAGDTSLLVTVGTAICGGSAIAAVAPAIRAKDSDVSMALVTVFVLNGLALLIFPAIGHHFRLNQDHFGLWCALAIHDTSSVVGAASQYGERALAIATAAKLARALWIVPVAFVLATHRARATRDAPQPSARKTRRPWFIAGFFATSALASFVPALRGPGHILAAAAHRLLAVTLFVIGLGVSRAALRALGFRPLVHALTLWIVLASATLGAILLGWIG